jgi:hypothetical protein
MHLELLVEPFVQHMPTSLLKIGKNCAAPAPGQPDTRRLLLLAGKLLLSADYSQLELRLLAHFSGDLLLQQLLQQSGAQGDVFSLIAEAWLQPAGQRTAPRGEQLQNSEPFPSICKVPVQEAPKTQLFTHGGTSLTLQLVAGPTCAHGLPCYAFSVDTLRIDKQLTLL